MTPRILLRALPPLGWLLLVAAVVAVLIVVGRGLGFNWDPFGLGARRLEAAEHRAEAATADASARALEVDGAVAQAERLERHHQQAVGMARATAAAEVAARNAHDSRLPLDPDRAARLRAHDRELCRLAPGVCPAAPADLTGQRTDALPTGSTARSADIG